MRAIVYHLGDFTLQALDKSKAIAWQLNSHLKIVPGSHDRRWLTQFKADDPELHTARGHPIVLLPPFVWSSAKPGFVAGCVTGILHKQQSP